MNHDNRKLGPSRDPITGAYPMGTGVAVAAVVVELAS